MSEPHVTLLATSLNPHSRSQTLARETAARLEVAGVASELVDLRQVALPFGGDPAVWSSEAAKTVGEATRRASHLVFAAPVYNYGLSATTKNVLEVVPKDALREKVVGLLCSAGGRTSFMAAMPFVASLMLDFRCWVAPSAVYAVPDDFEGDRLVSDECRHRIDRLVDDLLAGPRGSRC